MSSFRRTIPDFQTANPLYVGAQVFAFVVNAQGEVTDQLASLYAGTRGNQTVANPQILDGDGKFERPVYIEQPISLSVVSATVGTHSTGIVLPLGLWRGYWAAGTTYNTNDFVANGDPDYPVIYGASGVFTARDTIAADIAAGDLVKIFDAGLVDAARDGAVEALNAVNLIRADVSDKAATVATQFTQSNTKFTQFRNAYYGPSATPPTTRPDGTAPQDGDTYLRTTSPQGLHYRLGGSWIVPSSDTVTLNNKLDKAHEGSGGTGIHPNASTSISGFMSATDKAKLDGVQNGANNYVHPSGDGNRHVPATTSADTGKFLKSAGAAGADPAWNTLTKGDVGLSNVDNTSDVNKPISTAQQAALNAKQNNLGFTPVQQGTGIGQFSSIIKIGNDGLGPRMTIDSTDFGRIWTNAGAPLFAGAMNLPNGIQVRWGSGVATISNGGVTIFYETPFSGGTSIVIPVNGDHGNSVNRGVTFQAAGASNTSFTFGVTNSAGNGNNIRVNYIAIGF